MKPLILQYSILRGNECAKANQIFGYNPTLSMNEVVINNKTHLAIEIPEQTHLCTLTKAGREDTDDAINLGTATEVHREAETDSLTEMETRVVREEMPMLLEMVTKTFTSTESDDESFNYL